MYVYRFLNQHQQILYVGRTNNVVRRLRNEHFTPKGHLPKQCYEDTVTIEWAQTNSPNEAKMYELYYIEQYKPPYNQSDIGGGAFSFTLQELTWQPFNRDPLPAPMTKQAMRELLLSFSDEIAAECHYADTLLQKKDQLTWLDKLEPHERNEYLQLVYSLERFVQNAKAHTDELREKMT